PALLATISTARRVPVWVGANTSNTEQLAFGWSVTLEQLSCVIAKSPGRSPPSWREPSTSGRALVAVIVSVCGDPCWPSVTAPKSRLVGCRARVGAGVGVGDTAGEGVTVSVAVGCSVGLAVAASGVLVAVGVGVAVAAPGGGSTSNAKVWGSLVLPARSVARMLRVCGPGALIVTSGWKVTSFA